MFHSEILKGRLKALKKRNPSYSLRAFSIFLEISPSHLSQILKGKRAMSETTATQLASKLNLDNKEAEYFLKSVRAMKYKDDALKKKIYSEIDNYCELKSRKKTISEANFRLIAYWYTGAVIALIDLKKGSVGSKSIAEHLGITEADAKGVLQDLIKVGIVEFTKETYTLTNNTISVNDNVSDAIKSYHHSMLGQVRDSIYTTPPGERDVTSVTISFDSNKISEVKEKIRNFKQEIAQQFSQSDSNNSVYNLGVHFVRLDNRKAVKENFR